MYGLLASKMPTANRGLYIVDRKTRQTRRLPAPDGFARAVWSPDSRHVVATNGTRFLLYDFATRKWEELTSGVGLGLPFWSRDGKFVYYQELFGEPDQPIYRVHIGTHKRERLMSLKQIPQSNVNRYGLAGLAANDVPVASVVRTNSDIYALELELP